MGLSFKVTLIDEKAQPMVGSVVELRQFGADLRPTAIGSATTDAAGVAIGAFTRSSSKSYRFRLMLKKDDGSYLSLSPEAANAVDTDTTTFLNFGVLTVFDRPTFTIAGVDYYAVDAEQVTLARVAGASTWATVGYAAGDTTAASASSASASTVNGQVVSELASLRTEAGSLGALVAKLETAVAASSSSTIVSLFPSVLTRMNSLEAKLKAAQSTIEASVVGGRSADASLLLSRMDGLEARLSAMTPSVSSSAQPATTSFDTGALESRLTDLASLIGALRSDVGALKREPVASTATVVTEVDLSGIESRLDAIASSFDALRPNVGEPSAPVSTTPAVPSSSAPASTSAGTRTDTVALQDVMGAIARQAEGVRASLSSAGSSLNLSNVSLSLRYLPDETGTAARALSLDQIERLHPNLFNTVSFGLNANAPTPTVEPPRVTVPSLLSASESLARRLVEAVGLRLLVREQWGADEGIPEGAVVQQQPAAGEQVSPGAEIVVFIFKRLIPTAVEG